MGETEMERDRTWAAPLAPAAAGRRAMSQAEDTRDYFHALYTVAHATASSLELEEVLNNIARSVGEALHVKACALRLLGSDRETLGMRVAYGLSERYLAK